MINEKECCPKFDPTLWDDKTFEWDNKKFIQEKVFTLFYIPLNFGSVMIRNVSMLNKLGTDIQGGMVLSEHTSEWNMDLFLAVDQEIPGAKNITLRGKFISKVYEGNFKDTGLWMKDFETYTKEKGLTVSKMFMWYTTCPKCAKKYGKNYVVIVGKI